MEATPFTLKVRMLNAEVTGDPAVGVRNEDPRLGSFR